MVPGRHDIRRDMKTTVPSWISVALVVFLLVSTLGHERQVRTRHPHNGGALHHHPRPVRAALRSGASSSIYESGASRDPDSDPSTYTQIYSEQHVKLTLECAINMSFSSSVWLKDGQMVQTILKDNINNKRVSGHRFLVDSRGNLLIENVRLEDNGRWQCQADDIGFAVSGKPIQLTVLDPPEKPYLLIDNRILDPGNLFIPVKENSDLTVSCVVDGGNPKPTLSWELALGSLSLLDAPEVPYQALNFSETVREQRVGARSDVRLESVMRVHHNATLTCLVHHVALNHPLNVSLLLDVQYTPSFAISREPGFGIPIREGMAVSLKCDVDANPRAAPIWQKDDTSPPVQQTPDGFLNFTEIQKEHSGWYKCIARHLLGKFSSIGYFLNVRSNADVTQEPEFDVRELSSTGRQMEVDLGGAVHLSCPPGTTGCWTKLDPETGRLEPLGASQDLRIDHILYQEAGEYSCVVPTATSSSASGSSSTSKKASTANGIGGGGNASVRNKKLDALRKALSVNIAVTGRPIVFPSNRSITAIYGQPLKLTTDFCANPAYTKVIWIVNDKVYKPGDSDQKIIAHTISNTTTPNCHQASLYLMKVTSKDVGEYSFIVRSINGLGEGVFIVNLTYASGYSVNLLSSNSGARHDWLSSSMYIHVFITILTIIKSC